ncbi:MAG: thermonuclease family protein [Elusimicrobiota bacterium]
MRKPLVLIGCLFFSYIAYGETTVRVKRVIDGDTLLLTNNTRVRLIGIDTPEVHPSEKLNQDAARTRRDVQVIQSLGRKSSEFVKKLVQGKSIRLEYEVANKVTGHKDRHGRILAYVYFEPKDCGNLDFELAEEVCERDSYEKGFLNALIIEAGYARAFSRYPYKYLEPFRKLEQEARKEKRGLWKDKTMEVKLVNEPLLREKSSQQ